MGYFPERKTTMSKFTPEQLARLRISAKELKTASAIAEREAEAERLEQAQKTPPVGFKFPDDVLEDAEPSVVAERIKDEENQ